MSNKEKSQRDFFSDLMFGQRPVETSSKQVKDEPKEDHSNKENDVPPIELDKLFTFVQSIGPTISKLAPILEVVNSFLSKKKSDEETTDHSTKKENTNE